MKSSKDAENTNISTCLSWKNNIIVGEGDDWRNISEQLSVFHKAASNFENTEK